MFCGRIALRQINPFISQNVAKGLSSKTPLDQLNIDQVQGMTREQSAFRQTVRSFMEKELPTATVLKMDADNGWSEFRNFWLKLGNMGLMGPTASSKYGGLEVGYFEHVLIMEELSRMCPSIGLAYGAHSNLCVNQITLNGNDEQRQQYLPKLIDGSFVGSLAMSEAESGSDVTSMRLKAVKNSSGDYVLNGSKFWITNGSEADVVFTYCRTSEKGITPFLVDTKSKGFSVGKKMDKMGMRASPTAELIFEDVVVPASAMVGSLDEGVYVLMSGLDYERLVLAAGPLGIMQRAIEEAFAYCHDRKQFGKQIGQFQLVQGMMADMYTEVAACRSFLYNTARAIDKEKKDKSGDGKKPLHHTSIFTKDCAGVILYLAEAATRISLKAIQLMGGNGYTNDYIASMLMRDAKLYEIGAGTSEIRRWLIGRELNKEYNQK